MIVVIFNSSAPEGCGYNLEYVAVEGILVTDI